MSALDATTVLAALEGMAHPPGFDGEEQHNITAHDKHIEVR